MKMEATMYNDELQQGSMKDLKRPMTLDFLAGKPKRARIAATNPALLASPDLNMLKLASPELERLIIQQNGMITTPTPTQFICPKYVTEEQEAYARGFVDALENLHKSTSSYNDEESQHSQDASESNDSYSYASSQQTVSYSQVPQTYTTLSTVTSLSSMQNINSSVSSMLPNSFAESRSVSSIPQQNTLAFIKDEPQTVPSYPASISSSPPMSPINMESQEIIKVERKRARNRIAARKCRHRKLERIARLEDKVSELKSQNSNLSNTASTLREQVMCLKQQILEHVKSGCQVMMSQNLTF